MTANQDMKHLLESRHTADDRHTPEIVGKHFQPDRNFGYLLMVAVVMLASVAVSASVVKAQTHRLAGKIEDLRKQRKELQETQAEIAAKLNAAEADIDSLTAALMKVQQSVNSQQDSYDAAKSAASTAETALREAKKVVDEHSRNIQETSLNLQKTTVESYIRLHSPVGSTGFLDADPWQNTRNKALLAFAVDGGIDVIDRLRATEAQLEEAENLLAGAAVEAQHHKNEAEERLQELLAARNREAKFAEEAEKRLDSLLYESQLMQDLDEKLAAEIAREVQKLAEALARTQVKAAEATLPAGSKVRLVSVKGLIVSETIAADTEGLLTAMEAKGYKLGGGGYRSPAAQISLRKAHCGTSEYAIWHMPASKCSPPTARPGRSDHERGLAIDFTYQGRIISNRSSAVFKELQRTAPDFGFVNLPSEPWHWSNTPQG